MTWDLITKYLLGESVKEEKEQVVKWINENGVNRELVDKLLELIELSRPFNAESAFQKFRGDMEDE